LAGSRWINLDAEQGYHTRDFVDGCRAEG
jgi:hypothetical protein